VPSEGGGSGPRFSFPFAISLTASNSPALRSARNRISQQRRSASALPLRAQRAGLQCKPAHLPFFISPQHHRPHAPRAGGDPFAIAAAGRRRRVKDRCALARHDYSMPAAIEASGFDIGVDRQALGKAYPAAAAMMM